MAKPKYFVSFTLMISLLLTLMLPISEVLHSGLFLPSNMNAISISIHIWMELDRDLSKSFMYAMNKRGPKHDSCGIYRKLSASLTFALQGSNSVEGRLGIM